MGCIPAWKWTLYFKSGYHQAHLGFRAVEVQLLSQSHLGRRRAQWPNYPALMGSESNEEHPITGSFLQHRQPDHSRAVEPWQEKGLTSTSF